MYIIDVKSPPQMLANARALDCMLIDLDFPPTFPTHQYFPYGMNLLQCEFVFP